jgi:DNA polymerase
MPLDFNSLLFIDFEAQSEVSIDDCGAYAYAEHPSTVPLCAAWAIGDGPVQLWREADPVPREWAAWSIAAPDSPPWVAQNHETERELLRQKFGIIVDNWIDTATLASAAGLPRKLGEIAEALKLPEQKGSKTVMMMLARPRRPSRDNPDKFWRPWARPDLFEQLYDYCKQDVVTMRAILKALPPYHWVMPAREEQLNRLTQQMNRTGVLIDLGAVEKALHAVEAHAQELRHEFATLLPGINPRSPVRCAEALGLPNVQKPTVRDALKIEPEGPRRRALEVLKTLATAAVSKLDAFQDRACGGRLHGAMVFHGAGRTGRWSSMGVQLQNLIRGLGSSTPDWPAIDTSDDAMGLAFEALHGGVLAELYENPTRVVASMMRGFILGPLLAGDFSQIEARVLAKVAGQLDLLEAFATKKDPYKLMAAYIYGKPLERISKDERFMGKQCILGCGYGLGRDGFIYMLKSIYDIDVTEQEADRIVKAYRSTNPKIVELWWELERLVKVAVLEQPQQFIKSPKVPGIGVRTFKSWLCLRLPSGRVLWYYEPTLEPSERGLQLFYWGRNPKYGGKWMRVKTYGGKLVENITQAIARDIMGEAMLRLASNGFPPLLTVHDEIVTAASEPEDTRETAKFETLMRETPSWFPGIPLDVEVQWARRYQK